MEWGGDRVWRKETSKKDCTGDNRSVSKTITERTEVGSGG